MKIIHVVYSLEMGGAEVLVSQLSKVQRDGGHDVSVLAYSNLGALGEALAADGIPVHITGEAHPAVTMLRCFKFFRVSRPDVVHCHNPAPTLQATLSARLAGINRIISTRHSLVAPPYDLAAERKYNAITNFCDVIVGICEITCANLRGTPGAHRNKIVRVYNGTAALVRESPATLARTGFTLLFVGRLAPVKDLGTLIRAAGLAAPRVPHLQLWIVGGGEIRAELEKLVAELALGEVVRFWGQQMDTARFFSAANVFAMSSVSEGLPMSLLQAMSLGVPALTTDVGGMAEVIRLGECGLLAPVGDSAAMAGAIVRLSQDPELCAQLGSNGKAAYQREFTLERMSDHYLELYTS